MGFYQDHCSYLPAMAGWFLFSALLSSYNKMVFGADHRAFPCPLLMTSVHFCAQWVFAETLCTLWPVRFGAARIDQMSWNEWFKVSVPCGLITSGDVGLSNLSMVFITLTFYTMVKASTPIFVLGWAYLFGIEEITWSLMGVVLIIAMGELLTVMGETEFQLHGFLLCLGASVLSGARWTLVQLKLQSLEPPLKTTIATMRLLAPSMSLSMIFVSIIIERPWIKLAGTSAVQGLTIFGLGLFGACFAIAMIVCEFYLIMRASAMILMIGGVMKEMITILVGVWFFDDELNSTNIAGVVIVFLGVVAYKVTFHLNKKKGTHHAKPPGRRVDGTDAAANGSVRYSHVDSGIDEHEADGLHLDVVDGVGEGEEWNRLRQDLTRNGSIELRHKGATDTKDPPEAMGLD